MLALDRRRLLQLAGAAALSSGVYSPRRAAGLKKAVGIGMVDEGRTLADKMQLLAELGFDGVELTSPSELSTDEVLSAKEKSGLEVSNVVDSFHWKKTLGDPDAEVRRQGRAGLALALSDCKAWGGSSVLLVPAVVNKTIGYGEAYERSQAEIRAVLPLAEELGVTIAVENVWNNFLLSPLEAARYIDELGSPRVRWHMDVGNVVNYGWPEQWIRILGKRIVCLHIKEFSRKKRDEEGLWKGFEVELGEGDCDWPAVKSALDDVGYSGWAVAEVSGGTGEKLRDIKARMDRILAG